MATITVCTSYGSGHNVHWIHGRKTLERTRYPATVTDLGDGWMRIEYLDEDIVGWCHNAEQLLAAITVITQPGGPLSATAAPSSGPMVLVTPLPDETVMYEPRFRVLYVTCPGPDGAPGGSRQLGYIAEDPQPCALKTVERRD